jgi:hypothetical protein
VVTREALEMVGSGMLIGAGWAPGHGDDVVGGAHAIGPRNMFACSVASVSPRQAVSSPPEAVVCQVRDPRQSPAAVTGAGSQ